jgi:Domain of unknown function (DUF6883)
MARMAWPPTIGDHLPRPNEAFGISEKLTAYCLNLDHEIGASKAEGFSRILGVTSTDVEYLADALQQGLFRAPITDVRDNSPFGVLCEVRIEVAGLRGHEHRTAAVTTSWELRGPDDPPRLVTAYIDR